MERFEPPLCAIRVDEEPACLRRPLSCRTRGFPQWAALTQCRPGGHPHLPQHPGKLLNEHSRYMPRLWFTWGIYSAARLQQPPVSPGHVIGGAQEPHPLCNGLARNSALMQRTPHHANSLGFPRPEGHC
ncbi:hypothetical protein AVEN_110492-1 [Araneus ventricosus]|uniref:Uncharacterized protein n=1 Tax=Araneus ventricosus TaxID=182803 RepID=A0A4Y2VIP2_ARAVE|nr:hypothetical protein AVEN_110492-1 [Araneus ventricosus]